MRFEAPPANRAKIEGFSPLSPGFNPGIKFDGSALQLAISGSIRRHADPYADYADYVPLLLLHR